MDNGIEWPFIDALAVNADGDLFAGTTEGGGVYRSLDNGDSWTLINDGLTTTYVAGLTVTPNGDVFAGTWSGGVFRSSDNGDHWDPVNTA